MTTATSPWRIRRHIGDPEVGPAGHIRVWPAFSVVVFSDAEGRLADPVRVAVVGPTWPGRLGFPSAAERYAIGMPAGGELALKRRLTELGDARQRAWEAHAGSALGAPDSSSSVEAA